jgi:two-component system OmpR family response regulator
MGTVETKSPSPRVVVIDDEHSIREMLDIGLAQAGFAVRTAVDGPDGLTAIRDWSPDCVVLDIMMPKIDGLSLIPLLRRLTEVPIIMLTARGDVRDRIDGLKAGADDYLPKPFDLDELLARLRALRRRTSYADQSAVDVGDLTVDPEARRVRRAGAEIELSAREFDILHLLVARAGKVVSRYTILDEVWDGETDLRSNAIDVHLASIRAKIDKPFGTHTITTLRGAGYRVELEDPVDVRLPPG